MNLAELLNLAASKVPWLPVWLTSSLAVITVLVGIFALQDFAMRLAGRHVTRYGLVSKLLYQRSRNILRFGVVVLALSVLIPTLPISKDVNSVIHNVLVASIILLIGWIVNIAANIAAESYLNKLNLHQADNLLARKAMTQVRVLKRCISLVIMLLTIGFAFMTFDSVRQFGISIFASAGAAGLILGLAARPVLSNLIAGVQIALTQPIRIEDAVVVENEWGWIEELDSTYVVVRLWDRRRLIVPLSYFLEKPFQNWTRRGASIIGTVLLYLDYSAPIGRIRDEVTRIVSGSKLWDQDVVNLQVTDTKENTIEVRILVSAADSPSAWDLRCEVREKILAFIRSEVPLALPRRRNVTEVHDLDPEAHSMPPAVN
jgi:small-conductance mechanosensitive channel